jgi:lipopolysaccharide export system permease protein
MKIIDKYIFREFLVFFCAVIFGFVILMTGNTIFLMSDLIMNKKIPFFIVSQILILRMPAMFVLGFPVATVFAVMLTMGRLAKDSELVAMRTGGISFQRIITPLLVMSILISISSFYLNEIVVPSANHTSQNYIRQFFLSEVMENAKANVFFRIPGGLILYTKKYDEQSKGLRNLLVFETKEYGFPDITDVNDGTIVDEGNENLLILEDGTTYSIDKDGMVDQIFNFKKSTKDISREIRKLYGEQKTPQEMVSGELKELIDQFKKHNLKVSAQETDYYFKFSIPVANLAFAIVGLLFAVSNPRKESYSGIIIALILITIYWVMMTVMRSMGQKGMMEPWLAAWGQNFVYFIIGIPILFITRK